MQCENRGEMPILNFKDASMKRECRMHVYSIDILGIITLILRDASVFPLVGHIRILRHIATVCRAVSDAHGKRALAQSIVKRSALYRSYIARN